LDRLKSTVISAFVIALLLAPAASAQAIAPQAAPALATAAKVEVVSGNGQLICTTCLSTTDRFFYPMVVKVSDANGNPIAGKTVTWGLVSSSGGGFPPSFANTSVTNPNGLAFSRPNALLSPSGNAVTPFLQTVISAMADTASVSFTITQALTDTSSSNAEFIFPQLVAPPAGTVLTGPAGTTGTAPIRIHIDAFGTPVPGISVRILNAEVTSPSGQVVISPSYASANCATGPGADPGSVLTDSSGNATCYPVFGPVPGNDSVSILVGGLSPTEFDQNQTGSVEPLPSAIAYAEFSQAVQLAVTQVTPGQMVIVSGDGQTVDPGRASAALVVKITDSTGALTIGNQSVVWTVASGAATVSPATSTTNATGQTQATVTFSPSAAGPVVVRAALTGAYNGIGKNFNLSTRVLIATLAKVSGDQQTTQSGQKFPADLVVQVLGTNGQPLANQPIGFQLTGGAAVLSTPSALTDATGEARVTVTAGTTPGTVTVSAAIQTFSQSFTLTVIPPGPALSSESFFNAGGLARIVALSPCGLVTVFASGLAPNVQGMVFNLTSFGPWATSLASDTVTVASVAAPIFSVGNVAGAEQLTFQVPCETAPANSVPITISVAGGTGTITFPVVEASPGIFETVMSDGVRRAVAVRPDGTFVSLQNPARRGETVRVFATGLGATSPSMVTGSLPVPGADSLPLGQIIVGVNNSGARVITSRVSPSLIGVFEITFEVPSDAPTGNDVVLNVAVNAVGETQTRFSNGSKLPIQ
jgi:uncharacterized protein (TIGR03437 family)